MVEAALHMDETIAHLSDGGEPDAFADWANNDELPGELTRRMGRKSQIFTSKKQSAPKNDQVVSLLRQIMHE